MEIILAGLDGYCFQILFRVRHTPDMPAPDSGTAGLGCQHGVAEGNLVHIEIDIAVPVVGRIRVVVHPIKGLLLIAAFGVHAGIGSKKVKLEEQQPITLEAKGYAVFVKE